MAMKEDGANLKAAKGLTKVIAVVVILVVAAFGDVMYIQEMSSKFPAGGPLLVMCYIGAFTSFLAVLYLLMGKSMAFRPGAQMIGAWVVFVAELLIIALNILMVFTSHADGMMAAWAYVSPATPVMHMLGVALLYFLDPDLALKHHAMEMFERMQKSEREVEELTHRAKIELRKKQVEHVSKSLEEAVNSPASLAYIQQFGYKINMELLTELTGMSSAAFGAPSAVPGLPAPGTPMALPPVSSNETEEWAANEGWLNQVNDRIASERARRLDEEAAQRASEVEDLHSVDHSNRVMGSGAILDDIKGAFGSVFGGKQKRGEDVQSGAYDLEQISRLVAAAEAKGYSLEQMERYIGSKPAPGLEMSARLTLLAAAAESKGYTAERIEHLFGLGGDDAKKK